MVKFYLRELVIRQPLAFYAEQPASKVIDEQQALFCPSGSD